MIEMLLSDDHGRLYMLVDRPFANHYERWGFHRVSRKEIPGSLSRDYEIGRIVTTISSASVASAPATLPAEIALELAHVCPQVDLSVRTSPNIVRRDTVGVPSQMIGIALKRAPERLMNLMSAVLRRFTVPDLADFGLPAPPGDGFSQFLRTRTV